MFDIFLRNNFKRVVAKLCVCVFTLVIFIFSSGFAIRITEIKLNDSGSGEFVFSINFKKKFQDTMKAVEIEQNAQNGNKGKNVWDYLVNEAGIQKKDLTDYGFKVADINDKDYTGYVSSKTFATIEELGKVMSYVTTNSDGSKKYVEIKSGVNEDFDLAKKFSQGLKINQANSEYFCDMDFTPEYDKNKTLLEDVVSKRLLTIEQTNDYEPLLRVSLYATPISHNATSVDDTGRVLTWNLSKAKFVKFNLPFKSQSSSWMLIVLLLLVIVVIGAAVFFIMSKKKAADTQVNQETNGNCRIKSNEFWNKF